MSEPSSPGERPGPAPVPTVLCQPDGRKSCGACCGMYNHRDASFVATVARIQARTAAYHRDADIADEASLRRFRARWEPQGAEEKLLSGLPSCPFLGFLTDGPIDLAAGQLPKVGCLVHPLQNDGLDGRDCGVYDRTICQDYLCAAHDLLSDDEKRLVLQAIDDSYLYGLVLTDVKFVRELFEAAAHRNGSYPRGKVLARAGAVAAARDYFELKRDWPYRADDGVFGQIEAGEGLETTRRPGPSAQLGVAADRLEAILTCLGTQIATLEELTEARRRVRARVSAFAEAVNS